MAVDDFSRLQDRSLVISEGLIAGEWKHAKGNKTFPVINPATGAILQECADLDRTAFIDAIRSAKCGTKAFSERTTAKERGSILRRWHDLVMANYLDSKPFTILSKV